LKQRALLEYRCRWIPLDNKRFDPYLNLKANFQAVTLLSQAALDPESLAFAKFCLKKLTNSLGLKLSLFGYTYEQVASTFATQ